MLLGWSILQLGPDLTGVYVNSVHNFSRTIVHGNLRGVNDIFLLIQDDLL